MKKPKTITNDTADALMGALDYEDRLIIRVGIETGLRIGDVLKLKGKHIKQPMRIFESKTKKYRDINISDELHNALQGHSRGSNYIFHGRQDRTYYKPLHRTTVHKRIKRAGFDCSAHSMRKLYAQNALKATGDIFAVQKLLNHKYVTDTARYLDIDLNEIIRQGVKV